jgi:type VI secretion system protein ImpL
MIRVLLGILAFVLYLALVIWLAFALHFAGTKLILFIVILGLLGAGIVSFVLWYLRPRNASAAGDVNSVDATNLAALLRDADSKVRQANRAGAKSLAAMPLLYIVGDENSAKTQTVLQAGLDPELLAGNVFQDGAVVPTSLANVWLTSTAALVEAGGPLLKQPGLWQRLVKATVPPHLGSALSSNKKIPARAIVVCVSIERILAPSTAEQIRALAQSLNERLRELSQILGVSLPVYVLFTKLDTIGSFGEFATRLSEEEVKQPIGSLVALQGAGSGLYAERAAAAIGTKFDQLVYALSEFRLDVLARGTEIQAQARAYEFPRDLRKLRAGILSLLVEIARPSQIGVNPFLRGFFFTGMRAHIVSDVLDVAATPSVPQAAPGTPEGATRVFSFSAMKAAAPAAAPRSRGTRKVPQWVFLPHLFSNILLADKSALEASRASTRTGGLKKLLLGTVSLLLLIVLAFATVSFFRNRALASRVAEAAAAPLAAVPSGSFPALADLQALDRQREVLEQLDKYRTDGAPWLNRMGLNQTSKLYPIACKAYGAHLRSLLLTPAQRNIVTALRAVPSAPKPEDDYSATYRPLKAYIITTSNPNPDSAADTIEFLPAALLNAWQGKNAADPGVAALAQTQFATYARLLAQPDSCMAGIGGSPDQPAIAQARGYLNGFQGFQHVYQSMLAAAGRKVPGFTFNGKYPNSSAHIVNTFPIQGAFTKDGFAFMQDAILHPDPYFRGEEWVLGPSSGQQIDRAALTAQLRQAYYANFIQTWRTYLAKSTFVGYRNYADAGNRLSVLDSNTSPMLELFWLISSNTAVAAPEIASQFQAPQAVVPPSNSDSRLLASPNQAYITGLQNLEGAVKNLATAPNQNDPAAAAPVSQAAISAEQAAENLRNSFTPDRTANLDQTSFRLLQAPIESAKALAAQAPAAAAGGGAKSFCAAAEPVFVKFPFNPQSTVDATPEEVAQIFAQPQGTFWQFYNNSLKSMVQQTGTSFTPMPGSTVKFGRGFLSFLNHAATISTAFFPTGNQPSLNFTLTPDKADSIPNAVLNIDGQQLTVTSAPTTFHWVAQPASHVTLTGPINPPPYQGTWSVLRFAYESEHPAPNRLKNNFQVNNRTLGVVIYDASGSGAPLLNPEFMRGFRCVTNPAQ